MYKNSTLAISIVIMSIIFIDFIIFFVKHIFRKFGDDMKFKIGSKMLMGLAHIALWITAQIYVYKKDYDCKDYWKSQWVTLLVYIIYVYVLIVLNVISLVLSSVYCP
eukprot:TRINITY_DN1721_c0_g1_i10.p3 TRINITY_DN1721_c0_g1~~TRINITY_DN1721_c0_g1_i10.p3  ORF type:complete len:107 (+),score=15.15 TRINITY_DN1721_c0_g1_i10:497-817(+)